MPRYTVVCTIISVCLIAPLCGCKGNAQPEDPPAARVEAEKPLPDVGAMIDRMVTFDGCRDFTAEMRMTAVDESGKKDQIDFRVQRKYGEDRTKTFISVLAPLEESDKALLAIESSKSGTEAFSYLSGLKKLTRLNSGRQLGFRGARVTVQELLGMELNQYTHDKGERVVESGKSLIRVSFQEIPDRGLAFPRITGYFNEDDRTPVRFDLYDQQEKLVKAVNIETVKTISNRQTVTDVAIDDLQQKLKLRLVTRDVSYDQGIPDSVFTESHLINFINNASRMIDQ